MSYITTYAFHELFDVYPLLNQRSYLLKQIGEPEFVDDVAQHIWRDRLGMNIEGRIVNRECFEEWVKNQKGLVDFLPLSLNFLSGEFLNYFASRVKMRLFGSELPWREIYESVRKFRSKIEGHAFLQKYFPSLRPDNILVIDDVEDESIIMQTHYPSVLKFEHSGGGIGTQLIYSREELVSASKNTPNPNLVANLDASLEGRRFLEPYYSVLFSPSSLAFISDECIDIIGVSDQICDGFTYIGTNYPSKSNAKEITQMTVNIAEALRRESYRGPLNIDWIETIDGKLLVTEINSRYSKSFYPVMFAKKYAQKRMFTTWNGHMKYNPEQSYFQQLDAKLHDSWFDARTAVGILPFSLSYELPDSISNTPVRLTVFGRSLGELNNYLLKVHEMFS